MRGNCEICGNWEELEKHHVFGGALRPVSERYKATVRICPWCHRIDRDAVHNCRATREALQDRTQRRVMRERGWTMEQWISVFGKNHLIDGLEEDDGGEDTGAGFQLLEPAALPY